MLEKVEEPRIDVLGGAGRRQVWVDHVVVVPAVMHNVQTAVIDRRALDEDGDFPFQPAADRQPVGAVQHVVHLGHVVGVAWIAAQFLDQPRGEGMSDDDLPAAEIHPVKRALRVRDEPFHDQRRIAPVRFGRVPARCGRYTG